MPPKKPGLIQVCVYVTPSLHKAIRMAAGSQGVSQQKWLTQLLETTTRPFLELIEREPQTLAQLVEQNFQQLIEHNSIPRDTLKAIKEGAIPSDVDLLRIAMALDKSEREMKELLHLSFPNQEKQPNGEAAE
ncbi:hypothetical protein H6F93_01825 [Leptolyngbya sp. FACHB-671]|uniref:hypothetical protein n=1 Tax=Leptolyngbya sp. FACHB-671 TaxID=2692812 RepID=UPI0016898F53|nr:hypothetical protein [Leptolyngbya sp. FACHB-671]MBD2066278.1 hypothetical protein [Leptolyngbya sp. FACHB-671]